MPPFCLRREFVDRAFVRATAVNRGAIKASRGVPDHSVVGEPGLGRAGEAISYALRPLAAGGFRHFENHAD